jgi:hypothetical protein
LPVRCGQFSWVILLGLLKKEAEYSRAFLEKRMGVLPLAHSHNAGYASMV